MNFTEESIAGAAVGLARIKAGYRVLALPRESDDRTTLDLNDRMEVALDDDMNTAAAIAVLYEFAERPETNRERFAYWLSVLGIEPDSSWLEERRIELASDFVERLNDVLHDAGMDWVSRALDGAASHDAIERIVAMRNEARVKKNWSDSDKLRDALQRCGIELKDSKEGTTWTVVAAPTATR
jgi:cysteinyl-tRNA synthetase